MQKAEKQTGLEKAFKYGEVRSGPLRQSPGPQMNEELGPFNESADDDEDGLGPFGERRHEGDAGPFDGGTNEDVIPLNETRPAAKLDPSGEMRNVLSQIATQTVDERIEQIGPSAKRNDKDDVGPFSKGLVEDIESFNQSRPAAELDASGEMRDVLSQITTQGLREHDQTLATRGVEDCPGSILEVAKGSRKKRRRSSFEESTDNSSREGVEAKASTEITA